MNRILAAGLATTALLLVAGNVSARAVSERISVSATVVSTCLASSSSSTAPATQSTAGSPLAVSCSTASPVTVTLSADTVAGGLLAANLMQSAGALPGSLYASAAHLSGWADRTGSLAATSVALGAASTPGLSDLSPAAAAASSGTLTVTISY